MYSNTIFLVPLPLVSFSCGSAILAVKHDCSASFRAPSAIHSAFLFIPLLNARSLTLLLNCVRPVLQDRNTHNASGPSPCIERNLILNPPPLEECGKLWGRPNRGTSQWVGRQIVYLRVISSQQQLAE